MPKGKGPPAGTIEVFCRFIVKNGKKIFPKKAKCFHFFMRPQKK